LLQIGSDDGSIRHVIDTRTWKLVDSTNPP
jgi:hypothetical protein